MTIYLYVKQHSVTGLKYFGRTECKNPFRYKGSGSYWKKHLKKHLKQKRFLLAEKNNNHAIFIQTIFIIWGLLLEYPS